MSESELFVNNHGPYEKGYVHNGHKHRIDHYTFVHEGTTISIKYRTHKGEEVLKQNVVTGPARVFIAAGLFHEIEVLSDFGSWDCEFTIPKGFEDFVPYFSNEDRS